jgi:hypothetical protein
MRTIRLTLIFLFIVYVSFARKFQKGTIVMENYEIKEGFVIIPKSNNDKNISFKLDLNSDEITIPSVEIKSISVQSSNGDKYEFERLYTAFKPNIKKHKEKYWVILCSTGYLNLYEGAFSYESDEYGNVYIVDYEGNNNLASFNFFIKKKDEDVAIYFATTSPSPTFFGLNHTLRKNASNYLSDYPDLVKRINNKEFTHKDISKIIETYNYYMMNK